MTRIFQDSLAWVRDHQALTVALVVAAISLIVFAWYASVRAKAGLITAVVDLEEGKTPGGFREQYRRGAPFAWRLIALYIVFGILLSTLLGLPMTVLASIAVAVGSGAGWAVFILLIPVFALVAGYAHFIVKMAERAIVIHDERVWSALGSAHRLLFARPGQSILAVIVEVGMQIIFVLLIIAIIIIAIGLAALLALILSTILPSSILAAVIGAAVVLFVAGFFLLGGWFAAFTVSYWTLVQRTLRATIDPLSL